MLRGLPLSRGLRRVLAISVATSVAIVFAGVRSSTFSVGPVALQQRREPKVLQMAHVKPAVVVPGDGTSLTTARRLVALALMGAAMLRDAPRRGYKRPWAGLMTSQPGGRLCVDGESHPVIRGATATNEALNDWDPQKAVVRRINDAEFVKPAMWNQPLFRAIVLVLGGACAGRVVPFTGMLHISAYGIWLGTNVWTTFIAGITMFKSLPRQQFGSLQSKLFPKYFQLGTVCTAIMLLSSARLSLPMGPAAASLIFTLVNLIYLEPMSTRVMFERYKRENEGLKDPAIDKELKSEFGKLHGMSSLANMLALVALVTHGVYLSARL